MLWTVTAPWVGDVTEATSDHRGWAVERRWPTHRALDERSALAHTVHSQLLLIFCRREEEERGRRMGSRGGPLPSWFNQEER